MVMWYSQECNSQKSYSQECLDSWKCMIPWTKHYLKDEIKSLIRRGRLSRYMWYMEWKEHEEHDRRTRSRSLKQKDNNWTNAEKNQILGTVETTAGGFTGGGLLNKAWKWHLWTVMTMEAKWRKDQYKPIYFTEDDFGDIDRVHDDPMVILALVHNFLVKRILVD